jgi:hypothetical protein
MFGGSCNLKGGYRIANKRHYLKRRSRKVGNKRLKNRSKGVSRKSLKKIVKNINRESPH